MNENPYDRTDLFSKVTFSWLNPIIRLGAKRPLEQQDIYPLPKLHVAQEVFKLLQEAWQYELELESYCNKAHLRRAMFRTYWRELFYSCLISVVYVFAVIVQPFFIQSLLEFIQFKKTNFIGIESGFGVAGLLGALSFISVVSYSYSFAIVTRIGFYLRSSVILMVFNKSLKLSSASKMKHTSGEIVTLMSVDSERLLLGMIFSFWIFMGPIMIIVAIIILALAVDYAAIAGACTMILVSIMQSYLAKLIGDSRSDIVKRTDERVKVMNEVLQGIRVVKLYAWEVPIGAKIQELRKEETINVEWYQFLKILNGLSMFAGPLLIEFAVIIPYVYTGGELSIARVYFIYSILNIIRMPLFCLPGAFSFLAEMSISLDRITKFLLLEEIEEIPRIESGGGHSNTDDTKEGLGKVSSHLPVIIIKDADFSWSDGMDCCQVALNNIQMTVRQGEFVAMVGTVGSGKSSLLAAILGQMHRIRGSQQLTSKIAFVSQENWIQNRSLRDNILFDSPWEEDKYYQVIDAAQLTQDFLSLPSGDTTEIGEKGINLSGGQKARVSIARALYADDIDLYIFDDPLSAVDAHVGRALFEKALRGMLVQKARLVVLSSNYHYLPQFDTIFVVEDGRIVTSGSYSTIIATHPQYKTTEVVEGIQNKDTVGMTYAKEKESNGIDNDQVSMILEENGLGQSQQIVTNDSALPTFTTSTQKPMMKAEDRMTGAVTTVTYLRYFGAAISDIPHQQTAYGVIVVLAIIVMFAIAQVLLVYADYWVAFWAKNYQTGYLNYDETFFVKVYTALVISMTVAGFLRSYTFILIALRCCRSLHETAFHAILRSPITTFFDVTPMGRILNRFSKDLDSMDSLLPDAFLQTVQCALLVLAILGICLAASYYFVIVLVPIAILFIYIQNYYRKSSRELKRLENISRSPVYSLFEELLQGLSTIRAYGRQNMFLDRQFQVLDENTKSYFVFWMATRWLCLRLDFVSVLVILTISLLAVGVTTTGGVIDASVLGLALVYSMQLTGLLQWTIRCVVDMENYMTSVERILTFASLPPEAPAVIDSDPVLSKWPDHGNICIKNLSMRYRPGLNLVLKNLNIEIPAMNKVGVCGRTGSGKSSLMLALFRLVEPEPGSIIQIDGVDVTTIGLYSLRSSMTIIPQDPVMFSGTLRYNLDPFSIFSDEELWEALDRAQLKLDVLSKFPDKLQHIVSEKGENISVGQRQLICIARALLRRSKIIVLDEATASIDTLTDSKIQSAVRREFQQCTVLTIAHRLDTLADSSMIIVMSEGEIVEVGPPIELIKKTQGMFRGLVDEMNSKLHFSFI